MQNQKNWHQIILDVQNANLDKQSLENKIKRHNKIAYREQLDRQVQLKHKQNAIKNSQKAQQRQQAKTLAQLQMIAKIKQKCLKQQIQRKYGQQNRSLIDIHSKIKTASQQQERVNIQRFLEHPFVKLLDQQNKRKQQLKRKFIKQNQINHLQEKLKNQMKNTIRYKQSQQKNQFIDYVEKQHQKRSEERQRFKNKYLKIKKGEYQEPSKAMSNDQLYSTPSQEDPNINNSQFYQNSDSVQKAYINYLNRQMRVNKEKKIRQKHEIVDDQRLKKFYVKDQQQPDSSPAYLGRNPLSYERRRQLFYINKHLNTTHQRSMTTDVNRKYQLHKNQSYIKIPANNLNQFNKLASQMNPEQINYGLNKKNDNLNHIKNQKAESSIFRPKSNNQFAEPQYLYSTKLLKASQKSDRSQKRNYLFGDQEQHNPFKEYPDSHRRIKSQLEQNLYNKQRLNAYNSTQQSPQPNRRYEDNKYRTNQSVKTQSAPLPKRQYLKYDVISGKYVKCYF